MESSDYDATLAIVARYHRSWNFMSSCMKTLFVPVKINLLERQVEKKLQKDELELVTKPPKTRPFPGRQDSLSPDFQMEELLRKSDNGKDEVSEKYLRINGRYITDGQGVVPGVLLVTPQTVMFNPSVSDHLVIDRGRDAYTVKCPMKATRSIAYYNDIAAMVLGDVSAEFIPKLVTSGHKTWAERDNLSMNTSNYVSQDTIGMLSESNFSDMRERYSLESIDRTNSRFDETKKDQIPLSQTSTLSDNLSQDDTFTSCNCTKSSKTGSDLDNLTVEGRVKGNDIVNSIYTAETSSSRGSFTNHDRMDGAIKDSDIFTKQSNENTQKHAEGARDSIDIMDTKCTSTPRKIQENSIKNSKVAMHDDSGLIYTKIQPKNSMKKLTGNAIKLEASGKLEDSYVYGDKGNANSFIEGESLSQIDASRDSGISEGTSFTSTRSSLKHGLTNDVGNRPMSPKSSSLSDEARQWLGKRGIRYSADSDDEGHFTETMDTSQMELSKPRPASLTADELVYLCLRIHKAHWCRPSNLETHIMGIPQNRDQQRMEHWFAVPQERVNQLHTFFTTWKGIAKHGPENQGDDFSRTSDGLSIIDDTFARPSAEELLIERFEQAKKFAEPYKEGFLRASPLSGSRKSTLSSLNEDDVPELTDESNILENAHIEALSRELPSRTIGHRWNLVYSTAVHGISLKTLYRNTQDIETPILLVIVDQDGKTFGAFMSDPPKVSEGFYGTGESMLFTFKDNKIKAYRWTGINSFFIKGDTKCLSVGGGDGMFGLWLDEDLNHGRSHACKTFDNETLSSKEDFICRGLEAWSFE
ncbi:nuclear receptor coactivator 7-like isoform X2 [Rhopilema esculentum]|uniref:nuclear receptor coactivator 7-like isoform X2 n=1 Tax=Rhopilema esculentum TaxID=499914 RepID=UPI0031DD7383